MCRLLEAIYLLTESSTKERNVSRVDLKRLHTHFEIECFFIIVTVNI